MNTDSIRQQMVEQQVRTWDVLDPEVLQTLRDIPRERYVPAEFADCAYADAEIPIGFGQVMFRPSLDGRILQAVNIQPGESVLEVGTGTGYLTACISRLAASVTSIDLHQSFLDAACKKLVEDTADNITLSQMDASAELPDDEFDVVIVSGSLPRQDDRLATLLRPGGRLLTFIGESPAMTATLISHDQADELNVRGLFESDVAPLVRTSERSPFTF
ncbi:MAG: protein-L-isoaspartate O-methyltransferase [Woeseiaceae bacterium]|nr:protein-L-isoaspartate O-methyltransferase [Woeseiaceae bacterium]